MVFKKLNPKTFFRNFTINRRYKDRLFQKIFQNKKDLLDLYNAVNGTSYTNPTDLEITTLEDVIYLSMKNDLSFIISLTLNLYEHQSTFNPNMPIRGFMYFARLYETYIEKKNLNVYVKTPITLPRPQFVVFYNGRAEQPDEVILKLSDMFEPINDSYEPVLECRAQMLNINYGHNKKLLKKCRRLHDYAYFISMIHKNIDHGYDLKQAANMAIDACIDKNILTDILQKSRNEVLGMLLTEYDEKKFLKMTYEEGVNDGMEQGIQILIESYQELGISKETACFKLQQKYHLSEKQTNEYMKQYWK